MNFKNPERHRMEWWDLHPRLRLILCDADIWCMGHGIQMVITELLRTDEEQRHLYNTKQSKERVSLHQFGRAADLRQFTDSALCQQFMDYLNGKYVYDPKRPTLNGKPLNTVGYHGGTAMHFHLKCMDN